MKSDDEIVAEILTENGAEDTPENRAKARKSLTFASRRLAVARNEFAGAVGHAAGRIIGKLR